LQQLSGGSVLKRGAPLMIRDLEFSHATKSSDQLSGDTSGQKGSGLQFGGFVPEPGGPPFTFF
jgi:hypothetical protein